MVELPRRHKRLIQVATDVLLVWAALWLAFVVRLGDTEDVEPFAGHAWLFITAPVIAIPLFVRFGMYRAVMRYFGNDALLAIGKAVTFSALLLALAVYWHQESTKLIPRSIVLNYWWLSLGMIGGLRLVMRQYFMGGWYAPERYGWLKGRDSGFPKVAIYGAGAAGNQLLAALRNSRSVLPVAFIDDDDGIAARVIAGLKVYKSKHVQQMIDEQGVSEVLLALPSVPRARRREIIEGLEPYPVHVRSMPGIMDIAAGRVQVDELQEVDIADLLGRDAVAPEAALIERCIAGQAVLVSGAGGSIGSELCRQIVLVQPRVLILFEHSEFNLYAIHSELSQLIKRQALSIELVPVLGSVRDAAHVLAVLRSWQVNTVYHAAAYKHVPMVEHNVAEGVSNNVHGTLNVARAAIEAGVANFVLISTDKAVRPTNVMGSTKRLAEMVLQALSRESRIAAASDNQLTVINRTRFTMVRFGNVLGSSGSVIPLFREQIRRGGPVTVTHPKITRYFMTIPEAAQLVIQAGSMGVGGDVFVLDMGEPVEITNLARRMIQLTGLTIRDESQPDGDIAIEFTGLRPGEKLYEELLIGDDVLPTDHPKIMRAQEESLPWSTLQHLLAELDEALQGQDMPRARQLLRQGVKGYRPEGDIVDWLYQRQQQVPSDRG
nr:nucleoside-diphosphate sugar epimerase/dehydratase [Atopomonas sediminilitoris]